jgi:hypothetical protein
MMARVKVTSSDIYARLAKGECANFRNGCQGRLPCLVVNGEVCQYFDDYVRPLLDTPEFAQRYAREAKVKLALNPDAKVVRKRRQAGAPALGNDAQPTKRETPAKVTAPVGPTARPVRTAQTAPKSPQPAAKAAVKPAPAPQSPAPKAVPAVQTAAKDTPRRPTADVSPVQTVIPATAVKAAAPDKRGPVAKPEAAPALQLEVNPAATPAQTARAKPAPSAKRPITTPQLELVLDFPLE